MDPTRPRTPRKNPTPRKRPFDYDVTLPYSPPEGASDEGSTAAGSSRSNSKRPRVSGSDRTVKDSESRVTNLAPKKLFGSPSEHQQCSLIDKKSEKSQEEGQNSVSNSSKSNSKKKKEKKHSKSKNAKIKKYIARYEERIARLKQNLGMKDDTEGQNTSCQSKSETVNPPSTKNSEVDGHTTDPTSSDINVHQSVDDNITHSVQKVIERSDRDREIQHENETTTKTSSLQNKEEYPCLAEKVTEKCVSFVTDHVSLDKSEGQENLKGKDCISSKIVKTTNYSQETSSIPLSESLSNTHLHSEGSEERTQGDGSVNKGHDTQASKIHEATKKDSSAESRPGQASPKKPVDFVKSFVDGVKSSLAESVQGLKCKTKSTIKDGTTVSSQSKDESKEPKKGRLKVKKKKSPLSVTYSQLGNTKSHIKHASELTQKHSAGALNLCWKSPGAPSTPKPPQSYCTTRILAKSVEKAKRRVMFSPDKGVRSVKKLLHGQSGSSSRSVKSAAAGNGEVSWVDADIVPLRDNEDDDNFSSTDNITKELPSNSREAPNTGACLSQPNSQTERNEETEKIVRKSRRLALKKEAKSKAPKKKAQGDNKTKKSKVKQKKDNSKSAAGETSLKNKNNTALSDNPLESDPEILRPGSKRKLSTKSLNVVEKPKKIKLSSKSETTLAESPPVSTATAEQPLQTTPSSSKSLLDTPMKDDGSLSAGYEFHASDSETPSEDLEELSKILLSLNQDTRSPPSSTSTSPAKSSSTPPKKMTPPGRVTPNKTPLKVSFRFRTPTKSPQMVKGQPNTKCSLGSSPACHVGSFSEQVKTSEPGVQDPPKSPLLSLPPKIGRLSGSSIEVLDTQIEGQSSSHIPVASERNTTPAVVTITTPPRRKASKRPFPLTKSMIRSNPGKKINQLSMRKKQLGSGWCTEVPGTEGEEDNKGFFDDQVESPGDRLKIVEVDDDEEWEDEELEEKLEEKAKKQKIQLTARNIKTIIREVITNEQVIDMVRNTLLEEGLEDQLKEAIFEPRLTRGKVKKAIEKGNIPTIWPLTPVKGTPPKLEPKAFTELEFPEDEDDDDYNPIYDESDVDSESVVSSRASDFGSPRSHLATPTPSTPSTPSGNARRRLLIENTASQSMDEPPLSQRLRSKLSLTDTPLETIEASFVAPDITPDLYNDIDYSTPTEKDWQTFLAHLNTTTSSEMNDTYDEKNDPEYNFLQESEREDEDTGEYRTDKAVKITKKELTELMEELFDAYQDCVEDDTKDDMPSNQLVSSVQHQDGQFSKLKKSASPVKQPYKPKVPPIILDTPASLLVVGEVKDFIKEHDLFDGCVGSKENTESCKEEPMTVQKEIVKITLDEQLQLQDQMRKHVQLLAQTYVLSTSEASYSHVGTKATELLQELNLLSQCYSQKTGLRSYFHAINLEKAVNTVKAGLPQVPTEVVQNRIFKVLQKKGWKRTLGTPDRVALLWPQMEVFSTNDIFLFPQMLPETRFYERTNKPAFSIFSEAEDNLLALGLVQFEKIGSKSKCSALIREHMLPTKTEQQISLRLKRLRASSGPTNIIKELKLTNKLPEFERYFELESEEDICSPEERDPAVMPTWFKYYDRVRKDYRDGKFNAEEPDPNVTRCSTPESMEDYGADGLETEADSRRSLTVPCQSRKPLTRGGPEKKHPLTVQCGRTIITSPSSIKGCQIQTLPVPLEVPFVPSGSPGMLNQKQTIPVTQYVILTTPGGKADTSLVTPAITNPENPVIIMSSTELQKYGAQLINTVASTAESDSPIISLTKDCISHSECATATTPSVDPGIKIVPSPEKNVYRFQNAKENTEKPLSIDIETKMESPVIDTARNSVACSSDTVCQNKDSTTVASQEILASVPQIPITVALHQEPSPAAEPLLDICSVNGATTESENKLLPVQEVQSPDPDVRRQPVSGVNTLTADSTHQEVESKQSNETSSTDAATTDHNPSLEHVSENEPLEDPELVPPASQSEAKEDDNIDNTTPLKTKPSGDSPSKLLSPANLLLAGGNNIDNTDLDSCDIQLEADHTSFNESTDKSLEDADTSLYVINTPRKFIPNEETSCSPTVYSDRSLSNSPGFSDSTPPKNLNTPTKSAVEIMAAYAQYITTPPRKGTPQKPSPLVCSTPSPHKHFTPSKLFSSPTTKPPHTPTRFINIAPKPGQQSPPRVMSPIQKKKPKSPRRKILQQKARSILPKGFVPSTYPVSPTKKAAAHLKRRARRRGGPIKILPKAEVRKLDLDGEETPAAAEGNDTDMDVLETDFASEYDTLDSDFASEDNQSGEEKENNVKVLVPKPESAPPAKAKKQRRIKKKKKEKKPVERNESGSEDDGFAFGLRLGADSQDEGDDDDPLAQFMAASTTIRFDPKSRSAMDRQQSMSKAKAKRELTLHMLAPDLVGADVLRDERDTAFAQAYLTRVKEILKDEKGTLEAFLKLLYEFGQSEKTPVELHGEVEKLLSNHPEVLADFSGFLLPDQAQECGCFVNNLEFGRARCFLRKIETFFEKQPSHLQRILKAFATWNKAKGDADELRNQVLPLLRGQQHLVDQFTGLFSAEKPVNHHEDDFEEIHIQEDDDSTELPAAETSMEEVNLPEASEDALYGTNRCRCQCHDGSNKQYARRRNHCTACSMMIIGGKMYMQTMEKTLRPVQVQFLGSAPHCKRRNAEEGQKEDAAFSEDECYQDPLADATNDQQQPKKYKRKRKKVTKPKLKVKLPKCKQQEKHLKENQADLSVSTCLPNPKESQVVRLEHSEPSSPINITQDSLLTPQSSSLSANQPEVLPTDFSIFRKEIPTGQNTDSSNLGQLEVTSETKEVNDHSYVSEEPRVLASAKASSFKIIVETTMTGSTDRSLSTPRMRIASKDIRMTQVNSDPESSSSNTGSSGSHSNPSSQNLSVSNDTIPDANSNSSNLAPPEVPQFTGKARVVNAPPDVSLHDESANMVGQLTSTSIGKKKGDIILKINLGSGTVKDTGGSVSSSDQSQESRGPPVNSVVVEETTQDVLVCNKMPFGGGGLSSDKETTSSKTRLPEPFLHDDATMGFNVTVPEITNPITRIKNSDLVEKTDNGHFIETKTLPLNTLVAPTLPMTGSPISEELNVTLTDNKTGMPEISEDLSHKPDMPVIKGEQASLYRATSKPAEQMVAVIEQTESTDRTTTVEKLVWTRDEDKDILLTCKELGPTTETFLLVSQKLASKPTVDQVEQRFLKLMALLEAEQESESTGNDSTTHVTEEEEAILHDLTPARDVINAPKQTVVADRVTSDEKLNWTRDEDKDILLTCKELGATTEAFKILTQKLASQPTVDQVEQRFTELMKLFEAHQGGGSSSEDNDCVESSHR